MMETISLAVGEKPKLRIISVGGDLRLSGRESTNLEAKAPEESELKVLEEEGSFSLTCLSDCLVFLPREASVEGVGIGGDLRVTSVVGDLMIRQVGGDLSLRSVGNASFETVGGDFHARKVTGNLHVDGIGGDAIVDRVSGDVRFRSIGGDLSLRRVDGVVDAFVGGDAGLTFTTLSGEKLMVKAGGDLSCLLPQDASAAVAIQAGGDISFPDEVDAEETEEGVVALVFGDGEVEVSLHAGGDVWLRHGEEGMRTDYAGLGASIAAQVESEVEAGIAEMEARMEAMGAGMGVFDSERIGEQVRRAFTRARWKADRARKRAGRGRRKDSDKAEQRGRSVRLTLGGDVPTRSAVTEDERLTILRMLEKGTITVEEAEILLQALEGDS